MQQVYRDLCTWLRFTNLETKRAEDPQGEKASVAAQTHVQERYQHCRLRVETGERERDAERQKGRGEAKPSIRRKQQQQVSSSRAAVGSQALFDSRSRSTGSSAEVWRRRCTSPLRNRQLACTKRFQRKRRREGPRILCSTQGVHAMTEQGHQVYEKRGGRKAM